MKRVIFYSRVQLILFICAVLMSATCFVGMFFNPFHVLTFVMSVILMIAIYKEKMLVTINNNVYGNKRY